MHYITPQSRDRRIRMKAFLCIIMFNIIAQSIHESTERVKAEDIAMKDDAVAEESVKLEAGVNDHDETYAGPKEEGESDAVIAINIYVAAPTSKKTNPLKEM